MSLQVWLPMTEDLRQQGLSDVTVVNNGATFNSSGKLGGCYSFGTGDSYITIDPTPLKTFTEFSFACWVKIISWNTSYSTIFAAKNGTGASWNNLIFSLLRNSSSSTLCFNISNGSNYTTTNCQTGTLSLNTWYHITCTYKSGEIKLYQDGNVVSTYKTTVVPNFNSIANLWIGKSNASSYQSNNLMNDVRIYDHCLSPMEVKRISQGLVLHYPLNRGGLGPSNLIRNGFGELGSENWDSNTDISTSDIPSGQSDIKASFNGHTVEHVRIRSEHTYKISAWIKATTTSGNTYPSLYPYDVDGKFIQYHNCSSGFNLNTMTTLKQQLKTGDTKIYVDDLSQWNTNSGHYYNFAAIFDYTDGTGYTYPEGTYTQHIAQFCSGTNAKTNLDKTNNVITLTTAYTGPNKPAGTKLCASTAGAGYFYPWGTINLANIQNWTYKEAIFSGDNSRLRYAKTVTFWTYNNNRMAGIKMIDLTNESLDTAVEYDSSGYCHNGTKTGTFTYTTDSPKYTVSTHIDSTSSKIHISNFPTSGFGNSYSFAWWGKRTSNSSMFWGFSDGIRLNGMYIGTLWNTGDGSNNPIYKPGTTTTITAPSVNTWHHYVMTGDGTTCKLYLDGELYGQAKTYKAISGTSIYINGWDSSTTYCSNDMSMSDFRIYATALSATDVKSLYQNSATIDADGTIHGAIR